ncbi:MAG: serine hydrolase domain-containing protein [Rhizobiaceae bacterium]
MKQRSDRVRLTAQRYVDMGAYASLEWLVLRDGRTWLRGAVGKADPANDIALPESPIHRIYSMTKPVISAIILMLVEEGKLRLYDPVAAWIPSFARLEVMDPDGKRRKPSTFMNIEHLLTHRSGLTYGFLPDCHVAPLYRETTLRSDAGPLAGMIDIIAGLPLAFDPGTKWRYSVATDVLGRIIEIAENEPLNKVVRRRIIEPLGLADTDYRVPAEKRARLMPMFGNDNLDSLFKMPEGPQKLTPANVDELYPHDSPDFARGGYGLFSTLDDYALIADFLASGQNKAGDVLLSPHMTRMMWRNRIPDSQMPLLLGPVRLAGYGFGLAGRIMARHGEAESLSGANEFGWSGAASTFFWIDPDEPMVGILMAQYLGSRYPVADDIRAACYQALE